MGTGRKTIGKTPSRALAVALAIVAALSVAGLLLGWPVNGGTYIMLLILCAVAGVAVSFELDAEDRVLAGIALLVVAGLAGTLMLAAGAGALNEVLSGSRLLRHTATVPLMIFGTLLTAAAVALGIIVRHVEESPDEADGPGDTPDADAGSATAVMK